MDANGRILELEAKLAAIGRSQCVIEFDMDGTVLFANENFLATFGYQADEVIGRHHGMFIDSDTLASDDYLDFWARLRRGHFTSEEYKRIGKDGRHIWIQATYNPIFGADGRPCKVIKYATDVTGSKLQNADFSGQITAINKAQAIVEFDLSGNILWANANYLTITGYELEEIAGRHHRMFVDPDEVKHQAYEAFWSNLRRGAYQSGEYRRITREGCAIWLQASYNAILDLEGRPFKIVKYAIDLTEIVEQRQEAVRLEAARAAAESSALAKSEFLANMSHELRTPLSSILGFSNLIGAGGELSPRDQRYVGLIQSAGQTLLNVVNDILDFSKLEAGAVVLSPEAFSPREMLEDIADLMAEIAKGKGLSLTCDIDTDAMLSADHTRLKQVLLNLIGNAVKFTAQGGVTIKGRTEAIADGRMMLDVRVIDTGCGISAEAIERLFERFMQEDASVTRRFGGTGLGLAISQQIISLMDGQIGVESDGQTGSTFWFRVPCDVATDAMMTPSGPHPMTAVEVTPGLRVLLAEDHPANRMLITALLEPFDLVLDCVENGREALQAVQDQPYDLVLMDMQMPVMDGITATRAIRALTGPERDVPVVALTANILPAQIELCLEAGMQAHLTKPIDVKALHDVLHRCSLSRPIQTLAA